MMRKITGGCGWAERWWDWKNVCWKMQEVWSLESRYYKNKPLICWFWRRWSCGTPQAVWRRVWPSLLDSGFTLPPVICPGSSAQCGGWDSTWISSAVTSESPGHLPRHAVWELLFPGQWEELRISLFLVWPKIIERLLNIKRFYLLV